ncbi:MAG: helix-turn-helix domain-containing protein [Planctomycetota bacterium]
MGRAKVLDLLMLRADEPLHLREIARRSEVAVGQIQRELRDLTASGVLVKRRAGTRVLYRADTEHPLHGPLRELLVAEAGGVGVLIAEALRPLGPEAVCWVDGDPAELVTVGPGVLEVLPAVASLERRLGRRLVVTALPHRPGDAAGQSWYRGRGEAGVWLIGDGG